MAALMAAFMTAVTLGPWSQAQAQADIFEELAAAPSAETITCEEALALSPTASVLVFTSAGSYLAGFGIGAIRTRPLKGLRIWRSKAVRNSHRGR